MKRLATFVLALLLGFAALDSAADWIAYPGDYGIWFGNRLQSRRVERGAYQSPIWPQYEHHSHVWFEKTFNLMKPETVRFECDGNAQVWCTGLPAQDQAIEAVTNVFTIPAGPNVRVRISVENAARPPAIRIAGETVRTDTSWNAAWYAGEKMPAEIRADVAMPRTRVEPARLETLKGNHLLADFGRETYGYVRFVGVPRDCRVRVIYAESESEARDEDPIHDDSWEFIDIRAGDEFCAAIPHGFRYVHVMPADTPNLPCRALAMDYEERELPRKGSFRCSDEQINRIWDVADRTLALTCREVFIEGVKRDHWVWSGDAVQSCLMAYYRNGDYEGAKRTLWCVRGKDPVVKHLNTIMDYSFYWVIALRDFDLYAGDTLFLRQIYPRMVSLLDFVKGRLDAKGRPVAQPGDWVFVDWMKNPVANAPGVCSTEMILYAQALSAAAYVAERIGQADAAKAYRADAQRVKDDVMTTFWRGKKSALMHRLTPEGTLDDAVTPYPNLFALAYGYFDPKIGERVFKNIILNKKLTSFRTPYMRFYEMDLLCEKGLHKRVMDEMRSYWGGMLAEGATSFWECYDPKERDAAHYAMYGRPYGRSLCHAWGASPTYLIGKHYLGVRPTASGFSRYAVAPHLGGLTQMEGTVPTPSGCVRVSYANDALTVVGCPDGEGTLMWRGETRTIKPNERVTLTGGCANESAIREAIAKPVLNVLGAAGTSRTALLNAVEAADVAADDAWRALPDRASYEAHCAQQRKDFIAAIGGFPERTPLNARTTATFQSDDVRGEAVLFESQPGVYVTGLLYLPDPKRFAPPYPAFLVVCGHSRNGKDTAEYYRAGMLGARAGMAGFVLDPIEQGERMQVPSLGLVWGHNLFGATAALVGQSTARYRLWDAMRALDYLESRADIRKGGFGVMGNSGGGTMSALLAAVEPRIVAAAPSCYISTIRHVYTAIGPQDAEQNLFGQLAHGINHASLVLMGGNAVRLHACHGDFFPFSGTCATLRTVEETAARCGIAAERYGMTDELGWHGWRNGARASSVQWMRRWLKGEKDALPIDVEACRRMDLHPMPATPVPSRVTPEGAVAKLPGFRSVYAYLVDALDAAEKTRKPLAPAERAAIVCERAGIRLPAQNRFTVVPVATERVDGVTVERKVFHAASDFDVPAVFLRGPKADHEPILLLSDGARADLAADAAKYLAAGHPVICADLLGCGEVGAVGHRFYNAKNDDEEFAVMLYALGRSLVGVRAEEALAIAAHIKATYGKSPRIIANGRMAIPAAHAFAAQPGAIARVETRHAPPAWRESVRHPSAPLPFANIVHAALLSYDWPDLLAD